MCVQRNDKEMNKINNKRTLHTTVVVSFMCQPTGLRDAQIGGIFTRDEDLNQ